MSPTNFAYAIVGSRVPVTHLFSAGAGYLACRHHSIQKGKYCSECGQRLEEHFERIYSSAMVAAAKHYGCNPGVVWDLMREKRDSVNTPIPLAWWKATYSTSIYHDSLTDEDEIVIGIEIATTPFLGGKKYPVKDVGIGHLLEVSRTVAKELEHLQILGKPRLHVFAYC